MGSWYRVERNEDVPDTWTVYLHGEVGSFGITSGQFVEEISGIQAGVIKIHVNSPGGSVDDGLAIFNSLMSHPARIETYTDAAAHSIASVIVQAGEKRVMAPHSRMMVHQAMAGGMGVAVGYASDFEAFAAEAQKVADRLRETTAEIASIYSERSGKDAEYWLTKMADETRFTADQAVKEGLADEVGRDYDAQNFRIAANFDWSKYKEADAIRGELEAEASPDGALTAEETAEIRDFLASRRAEKPETPGAPPPDPRDAARRDLEAQLAAVQL